VIDQEQLTLIPPDRVHLQFDVYAVGPTDRIALTYTLHEGAAATMVVLETAGFELGDQSAPAVAGWILERLKSALERVSPF